MRIVVHIGLHKSGTTAVQYAWRRTYGRAGGVWYPQPRSWLPGHHDAVWPYLSATTTGEDNDVIFGWMLADKSSDLANYVAEAARRGVRTLLISSEELDRLRPADVPGLAALLAGHDVTVVATVTLPIHRWCAGWQELVKHGLNTYPREAAQDIARFTSLENGRLQELVRLLPAGRRVIRLVRSQPQEPNLAGDLARLVDVDEPTQDASESGIASNVSLGPSVEILRRLNASGETLGLKVGGDLRLAQITQRPLRYRETTELTAAYEVPSVIWRAAQSERDFLLRSSDGSDVHVDDPWDLLPRWLDDEPPSWYTEISRREADIPELENRAQCSTLLWRSQQEVFALRKRLALLENPVRNRPLRRRALRVLCGLRPDGWR